MWTRPVSDHVAANLRSSIVGAYKQINIFCKIIITVVWQLCLLDIIHFWQKSWWSLFYCTTYIFHMKNKHRVSAEVIKYCSAVKCMRNDKQPLWQCQHGIHWVITTLNIMLSLQNMTQYGKFLYPNAIDCAHVSNLAMWKFRIFAGTFTITGIWVTVTTASTAQLSFITIICNNNHNNTNAF